MDKNFNYLVQNIVNNLSASSDGRNKAYSVYKLVANIFTNYIADIKEQSRGHKLSQLPMLSTPITPHLLYKVQLPDGDNEVVSCEINNGLASGYETINNPEKITKFSLHNIYMDETPTAIVPFLPDETSFVGNLFDGTLPERIDKYELSNNGYIGYPAPVFISVNDSSTLVANDDDNTFVMANITINGFSENDTPLSENIPLPLSGVYQTKFNYARIDYVDVHQPGDITIDATITTIPPSDNIFEPSYVYETHEKNIYPIIYKIDNDNHRILINHYVSRTINELQINHTDQDTIEYVDLYFDGNKIENNFTQIVPDNILDRLYVVADNGYLYVVDKNKPIPGTIEGVNVLSDYYKNVSNAPLIKIRVTRNSADSYTIEPYYYRDEPGLSIKAYKITIHTPLDNKLYYYDKATESFVETTQDENSIDFTFFPPGTTSKGFYHPPISISGLPAGFNYVSIQYVTSNKEIERVTEAIPVDYRVVQSKIDLNNVTRPYGPYDKIAMDKSGTLLLYHISEDTVPTSNGLSDPYDSDHTVTKNTGCYSVILPAYFSHNKYIYDENNNVAYFLGQLRKATTSTSDITAEPHNIMGPLDGIGYIWGLPRHPGEHYIQYKKRIKQISTFSSLSTKTGLMHYINNAMMLKITKSFRITNPSYPSMVVVIKNNIVQIYHDSIAYYNNAPAKTYNTTAFSSIGSLLDQIAADGYTVTIANELLTNLPPAAIVNGSNLRQQRNELLGPGYVYKMLYEPYDGNQVKFHNSSWAKSIASTYGVSDIDYPDIISLDESALNSDGKAIYIDISNRYIHLNYMPYSLLYIDYDYIDHNFLFSIAPVYITDLSDKNDRALITNNTYTPSMEYEDIFAALGKLNIKRWR